MCFYKNLIKNSLYEINILSRLYNIKIPYTFTYCVKNLNNYNKNDFNKDFNKIRCFKKHPMILCHLPKYKNN